MTDQRDAVDVCSQTSKDAPSQPKPWSVEEWWAEKIKPSRQRNLDPSQRASRACLLRHLRRERYAEMPGK